MKKYYLGFGLFLFGNWAIAQSTDSSSVKLENPKEALKSIARAMPELGGTTKETVITTEKLTEEPVRIGRNITIIPGSALRNSSALTVDQILRFDGTIEIQSRGGYGSQADISMRGSTFQQVLICVDGVRITDPLTGHFNSNIPIPLSNIAEIEILKGPAAVQYGPDAVGGVINIITKTKNTEAQNNKGISYTTAWGDNSLRTSEFALESGYKKLHISIGSNRLKSDGQLNYRNTQNFFNNGSEYYGASYKFSKKTQLTYRFFNDSRTFGAQNFYTINKSDTATEHTSARWHMASLVQQIGKGRLTLDGFSRNNFDNYVYNSVTKANTHTTDVRLGQFNFYYPITTSFKVSAGGQYISRWIASNDRGNHKNYQYGGYASLLYNYKEKVFANLSGRYDYDQVYGGKVSPMFQVSAPIKSWTVRGMVAQGLRNPDFTEKFIGSALSTIGAGRNVGNPFLQPENTLSYEVGGDYFKKYNSKNTVKFSFTAFMRKGTNLIDYVTTNSNAIINNSNLLPNTNYFYTQNISSATTQGVESNFSYRFGQKKIKYVVQAGYLYAITNLDSGVLTKYISNAARHNASLNVTITRKAFELMISNQYRWRATAPTAETATRVAGASQEFWIANARLTYKPLKGLIQVFAQVENLGDLTYRDVLGAQMPRRWTSVGFRINLM